MSYLLSLFSRVRLFATPWTAARQASLSFTISRSLLTLVSIESVMPSDRLICHPLLLPSVFPSIRVFSDELALHIRWPKYWSFNFSISPSNEYSGLISFRIDWFGLLAQGTLRSLVQHHSSTPHVIHENQFQIKHLNIKKSPTNIVEENWVGDLFWGSGEKRRRQTLSQSLNPGSTKAKVDGL